MFKFKGLNRMGLDRVSLDQGGPNRISRSPVEKGATVVAGAALLAALLAPALSLAADEPPPPPPPVDLKIQAG